jgi:hypothetical protein
VLRVATSGAPGCGQGIEISPEWVGAAFILRTQQSMSKSDHIQRSPSDINRSSNIN